jgi:hypothetical protein
MATKRYEGSKQDLAEDRKGAKQLKLPLKQYEQTARDKAEDRKGQAKLKGKK